MTLPDSLADSLKVRLKGDAGLSDLTVAEIVKGLQGSTPVNWNLLLNKEIAPAPKDETDN